MCTLLDSLNIPIHILQWGILTWLEDDSEGHIDNSGIDIWCFKNLRSYYT